MADAKDWTQIARENVASDQHNSGCDVGDASIRLMRCNNALRSATIHQQSFVTTARRYKFDELTILHAEASAQLRQNMIMHRWPLLSAFKLRV